MFFDGPSNLNNLISFLCKILMKTKEIITSISAAFVIGIVFLTANNAILALGQEDNKFAVQATGKSIQDPLPGHESL